MQDKKITYEEKGILLPLKPDSETISHTSHEFKSFITSSKAYVQLLQRYIKKNFQDEKPLEYLEKMDIQLTKLNVQLSDFFDMLRIESHSLQIFLEQTTIKELIESAVHSATNLNKTHEIEVESLPEISILVDKQKIERALLHLLVNAAKYSQENQKVHVAVTCENTFVHIAVTNHGVDIDKKEKEKLFEPFYQSSKLGNQQGVGLGLYFVKAIALLHKGTVTLNTTKKGETTCVLSLPLQKS